MATTLILERGGAPSVPAIRRIGVADVREALAAGWRDFKANPTQLVFLAVIYPVIGLIAAQAMAGRSVMPLFWPMLSGFALIGPVAALGIYELSRRRERGLPVSWSNAFDVRHSPAILSILGLGLMLLGLFLLWLLAARLIHGMTMGALPPALSVADFVQQLFRTPEGWRLIVLGNLVGGVFALAVLALTVVSFPLLLDRAAEGRAVDAGTAIRTSLRAVRANPGPMLLWGLIVAGLLALGSLPLFVGLAVVLPVLGHATWHLYRRVVAD